MIFWRRKTRSDRPSSKLGTSWPKELLSSLAQGASFKLQWSSCPLDGTVRLRRCSGSYDGFAIDCLSRTCMESCFCFHWYRSKIPSVVSWKKIRGDLGNYCSLCELLFTIRSCRSECTRCTYTVFYKNIFNYGKIFHLMTYLITMY